MGWGRGEGWREGGREGRGWWGWGGGVKMGGIRGETGERRRGVCEGVCSGCNIREKCMDENVKRDRIICSNAKLPLSLPSLPSLPFPLPRLPI